MRNLLFDVRRAVLLILLAVRWLTAPVILYLLGLPQSASVVGVRLRRLIEQMGVTYNKIGQYLAMRFDILPPEICQELGQLFEDVPQMSVEVVQRRLEEELGRPLDQLFISFDPVPVGAASIAQVHKAVTFDKEVVAIKVQRPRIQEIFRADMRNLRRLARLADRLRLFGDIATVELVDEIMEYTLREMDFVSEGRMAERLRQDRTPFAYVPRIRWDLTTTRILTMEFIDGVSLLKICNLLEKGRVEECEALLPGVDLTEVISNLARACLHQLYVTGLFHGDPHPGNILIERDGTVVFIDFGIFGELTEGDRNLFKSYIENTVLGNIEEAFRSYTYLSTISPRTDMANFKRETMAVIRGWYNALRDPSTPLQDRYMAKYQNQIVEIMRRYHVRTQPDQLLFWRVMVVLDATALRLPIQFDTLSAMSDFFATIRQDLPERVAALALDQRQALTLLTLGRHFPGQFGKILGGLNRGSFNLLVESQSSFESRREEGQAPHRIALLLAGLSLIVLTFGAPGGVIVREIAGGICLVLIAAATLGFRH